MCAGFLRTPSDNETGLFPPGASDVLPSAERPKLLVRMVDGALGFRGKEECRTLFDGP